MFFAFLPPIDDDVMIPAAASRFDNIAESLGVSLESGHPLQLSVGKETNLLTVRRPEWLGSVLRSLHADHAVRAERAPE
jgi:hypothetical protein